MSLKFEKGRKRSSHKNYELHDKSMNNMKGLHIGIMNYVIKIRKKNSS